MLFNISSLQIGIKYAAQAELGRKEKKYG